jgi:Gram-negative bacterial TonB protein C-terminal
MCTGNYVDAEHLLTRIDPVAVGPSFVPIPVRLVINADGTVKQVHVIRATSGQRDSIERALAQWKLKPYEAGGQDVEIETGLLIKFTQAGGVSYSEF